MRQDPLKKQALKKLATSRCAEIAARPGHLPTKKVDKAFIHRVTKGSSGPVDRLVTTRLASRQVWSRVAHLSLSALQRLFGHTPSASTRKMVKSRPWTENSIPSDREVENAYGMLRQLLDFLSDSTDEMMAAHVIFNREGKLQKKDEEEKVDENDRMRGADSYIYSPMSAYRSQPIVRLDK